MMFFCVVNGIFYGIESGVTSWVTLMPRVHPVTGMVFVRSLQIGDNLCCVLLFCKWKALTVMQRLLPIASAT